jgi:hypothetical protein
MHFCIPRRTLITPPALQAHICVTHDTAPCITHGAARCTLHHTRRVLPGAPLHHTRSGAPCITYVAPCHMHFCITLRTLLTPPALQAHLCITHGVARLASDTARHQTLRALHVHLCITHGAAHLASRTARRAWHHTVAYEYNTVEYEYSTVEVQYSTVQYSRIRVQYSRVE